MNLYIPNSKKYPLKFKKTISSKQKAEKNYKTIEELFAGFDGEYEPVEIDWGKPVGKEIW